MGVKVCVGLKLECSSQAVTILTNVSTRTKLDNFFEAADVLYYTSTVFQIHVQFMKVDEIRLSNGLLFW